MIGYAYCGSFCTHAISFHQMSELLREGYEIQPIMSEKTYHTDTRFGTCKEMIQKVEHACGKNVIHSIEDAEQIGPRNLLDALIICPCTGNTLAKIAAGITDTAVCMAAKSHLRNNKPLLIALASNDALSANLKNIALLLGRKNIYFVPMIQDDIQKKPHSLVANFSQISPALKAVYNGEQLRPLFL